MADVQPTGASELNRTWLHRAASCYLRAGLVPDAARCFRDGGAYERAAQTWESIGVFDEAAHDYVAAGLAELAGWLLADELSDADGARSALAQPEPPPEVRLISGAGQRELRRHLVEARCVLLDAPSSPDRESTVVAVVEDVMAHLAGRPAPPRDPLLEPWAVALTEALNRPDLTACVFASAVRGQWVGAEERWDAWSRRRLHVPLVLSPPDPAANHRSVGDGTAREAG